MRRNRPSPAGRSRSILAGALALVATSTSASEHVILLHGLCRTKRSMSAMEAELHRAGYRVLNADYASRTVSVAELADKVLPQAIAECREEGATTIHFVAHSLGGILVRSYLARYPLPELGRVVMLAPPNQGSEVVDILGRLWIFGVVNGPAGRELGTGPESTPNRLGPVDFPLGVIAGNRSINLINSMFFIRGSDDGKVSVERTKTAGMTDHVVLPTAHPFLMRNRQAIRQTVRFLRTGAFEHSRAKSDTSD